MHPTFAFNAEPGFNSMRGDVMHFEMKGEKLTKEKVSTFKIGRAHV